MANGGPRVLIVIPAFNEERSIGATLEAVARECPWAEAVVIDDGSMDRTADIVRALKVSLIQLPVNIGGGGAVHTGLRYAIDRGFDVVVQLDADGQHPPDEVHRVIGPVWEGTCDVCVGSRFLGETFRQKRTRAMGNAVLGRFLSLVLRQRITDPTSGFRAFNRDAVDVVGNEFPYDFNEPESLVYLRRKGLRVREVGVRMEPRRAGVSTIRPVTAFVIALKAIVAVFRSVPSNNRRPVADRVEGGGDARGV